MNSRLLMVAFLCACLFTVPVAAQDSLNVNLIGSWCASEWEGHYNIQVDENLAFCSTGSSGLRIVDISDPHACTEIGTFIPGGSVTKTVVNDTLAFLTQYYGDVLIVSVADPANPSLISEIETVSGYGDIELVESYLYVLDSDSGVYIFDVSDPYQIVELNSYYNPDILYITDIEVIDSLLFVVEHTYFGAQLRSLNVSDPANIIEIGLFDELAETSGGMQYHDGFGYFKDNWFRVIQIVDLTDPAFPTSASSCSNDNNIWGYTVGNGCLYVSDEDTLKIYDVANPYNCQMANTLAPFCYGTAFYIDNERMVASGPVVDFEVFDVSSPAEPLKVSEFGRSGDIYHMKWVGDKLYILEALSGLRILDVAIPSEPVELGYLTTLGEPWDFNVEGDYAYIMDAVEGFEIVDISNPEIPELISTFERPDTFVVDVCAEGNSVYLVTGVDNFSAYLLESFDMSNPSDPVRLDFLQFGTSIYGKMDVANNLISLKFGSEFYFINAADPSNLWVESSLNISGYTILAAAGTTVCLAGSDGFECVDVSDPANPLIGNPITTADHLFDIAIGDDGFVYLAQFDNGILVADVRNYLTPIITGEYRLPGMAYAVAANDGYAVLSNLNHLEIFDCTDAVPVVNNPQHHQPVKFALLPPHPNPFNPSTAISLQLSAFSHVNLSVYDITGSKVATLIDGERYPGSYEVTFNGRDLPSGIYFVRLTAGDFQQTQKLVLLK